MRIVKTTLWTRILSLLLVGAMLLPCLTGCTEHGVNQTDNPTESQTTTTRNTEEPSTTEPPAVDSSTTEPSTTEPSTTEPPTTEPPADIPAERKDVTLRVWVTVEDRGEDGWIWQRLNAFEAAHPEYNFTFKLFNHSEGEAGDVAASNPSKAADVFLYSNGDIGMMHDAGVLARLEGEYEAQVRNDNFPSIVDSVTYIDGGIYGFPIASNTWFMYYNKDTYTPQDIQSMDALLSKGKVAFQMETAWYTGTFFLSNGFYMFGPSGADASAGISFTGAAACDSAKSMVDMVAHPNFVADIVGDGVSGMLNGTVDVMFSGWWDYQALEEGMGDKLGCAALPMITIGGRQVQMKAFTESKAVGVNPNSKNRDVAMMLAAFLASEESQLARYELRSITPVHRNLINNPKIASDKLALAEMSVIKNCAVAQPVIPAMSAFWAPMGVFGSKIVSGEITLDNYELNVSILNQEFDKVGL